MFQYSCMRRNILRAGCFISSRLLRATYTSASVIEVLSQGIGGVGREVESGGGMYRLKELIKKVGLVMNVC